MEGNYLLFFLTKIFKLSLDSISNRWGLTTWPNCSYVIFIVKRSVLLIILKKCSHILHSFNTTVYILRWTGCFTLILIFEISVCNACISIRDTRVRIHPRRHVCPPFHVIRSSTYWEHRQFFRVIADDPSRRPSSTKRVRAVGCFFFLFSSSHEGEKKKKERKIGCFSYWSRHTRVVDRAGHFFDKSAGKLRH